MTTKTQKKDPLAEGFKAFGQTYPDILSLELAAQRTRDRMIGDWIAGAARATARFFGRILAHAFQPQLRDATFAESAKEAREGAKVVRIETPAKSVANENRGAKAA
ncbi:MAG: hypothetical protein HY521_12345 [Proteobacteria bacterium]|nr:hypothetical protein [Pseudomonadota bacterium]